MKTKQNMCLKERDKENPYEIWVSKDGSWEWRVLKKWQLDDNKPYARWLCAVKSPFTHGSFDIGDVYVKEIKENAVKVETEIVTIDVTKQVGNALDKAGFNKENCSNEETDIEKAGIWDLMDAVSKKDNSKFSVNDASKELARRGF